MRIDHILEPATGELAQITTTSKHSVRLLLIIDENRLEWLMLEMKRKWKMFSATLD